MDVKACIILLLLVTATRRGDSFEFERIGEFINTNGPLYSVFIAHFKNISHVGFMVCGKFAHSQGADHYICSKLADISNFCSSHVLAHARHFTNSREDRWNVRLVYDDLKTSSVHGWFICRRFEEAPLNTADDYFVFVKYLSEDKGIGWFVCHKTEPRYHQCDRNDFYSSPY